MLYFPVADLSRRFENRNNRKVRRNNIRRRFSSTIQTGDRRAAVYVRRDVIELQDLNL